VILGTVAVAAGVYTWLIRPAEVVRIDKSRSGYSAVGDDSRGGGIIIHSRSSRGAADDPDAFMDNLILASASAQASGIAAANFIPPDWKPETVEEFLKKNKEFILDGDLNHDAKLRHMMDQDTAGMIVVENGPDGLVPVSQTPGKKE
jgi:hypothetical protein